MVPNHNCTHVMGTTPVSRPVRSLFADCSQPVRMPVCSRYAAFLCSIGDVKVSNTFDRRARNVVAGVEPSNGGKKGEENLCNFFVTMWKLWQNRNERFFEKKKSASKRPWSMT
ncbi:hypothetical protein Hdeb2414_s0009g00315291 [Helianthus debilis subsp. tardiflorus]